MTLRFGTDGVRGPADELTDELVAALGARRGHGARSGAAHVGRFVDRPRPARVRARASRRPWPAAWRPEGVAAELLGVVPTPAVAWVVRRPGRSRRDDLGVAQPVRRQRHQVLRRRWPQADRRRSRPSSRPSSTPARRIDAAGVRSPAVPARRARAPATSSATSSRRRRRSSGRRLDGLQVVIDCANGAASAVAPTRAATARRRASRCSTPSPTVATSTTACGSTHPEDLPAGGRGRRRRSAWPSTATPIGCWPSTRRARWSTATTSSPSARVDLRDRGRLRRRHGGRHRDDQPRASGWRWPTQGIEVVETAVGDRYVLEALETRRAARSVASSPVTSSSRTWPPPATAC